jgi:hypothetical protein
MKQGDMTMTETTLDIRTGMTIAELYEALPQPVNTYDRMIPKEFYVEAKGIHIISIEPPREDGQYWVRAYYMLQGGLAEPNTPIMVRRRPI